MMRSLIDRLEAAERLDGWSSKVRPLIDRRVGSGRPCDLLTGRWLGHAVHPATVLLPLG